MVRGPLPLSGSNRTDPVRICMPPPDVATIPPTSCVERGAMPGAMPSRKLDAFQYLRGSRSIEFPLVSASRLQTRTVLPVLRDRLVLAKW
jgi:hypothetical protein